MFVYKHIIIDDVEHEMEYSINSEKSVINVFKNTNNSKQPPYQHIMQIKIDEKPEITFKNKKFVTSNLEDYINKAIKVITETNASEIIKKLKTLELNNES